MNAEFDDEPELEPDPELLEPKPEELLFVPTPVAVAPGVAPVVVPFAAKLSTSLLPIQIVAKVGSTSIASGPASCRRG